MSAWNPKANEIFLAALDIDSTDDRHAYVNQACSGEPELSAEVHGLLAAADNAHSFLGAPASIGVVADPEATENFHQGDECPGDRIGPYELLEQIGEGGMGVVYMAQQTRPVKRQVALKIIKRGMDSREVIARFEAERQALAMMDHPNIARVFDGGTTEEGRPYFVMELVRGVPITEHCDEARLSNEARLRLFVDVCRAVQHAHQKGIIHRDLKPSNVLVTMHDDQPVPKVIDFGIAKALHQPLTERALFTGYRQLLGTPMYMSPEQAQMSGIDVDTRSDVYSLGVLLYELLTGTTPFTKASLLKASFDELRRLLIEQEPPRPSARLTTLEAQARSTIADRRRLDQRRISAVLRGELDWIVMKALEKDRNRRYESASAFAADIERFLKQEPVLACPPTVRYRLSKFVRRQRSRLLTTGLIGGGVLVLLAMFLQGEWSRQRREVQTTRAIESSLASAHAALAAKDVPLAEQYLVEARAGYQLAESNEKVILSRIAAVQGEVDRAKADEATYSRFIALARQAMDELSYGGEGGPSPEEARTALNLYGVLDQSNWTIALQQNHLSEPQKVQVRETAFELLILLADSMVRWPDLKSESAAREGQRYLDIARQFHEPTKVVHWVRKQLHVYLKEKEAAAAADALYKSTAPTIAWDWYLPGHSAGWAGNHDMAREAYLNTLQRNPKHFNSLFFLGARHATDGQYPQALAYFTASIALRPDHLFARCNRAKVLEKTGDHGGAEADFLAAVKCEASLSSHLFARKELGQFYLRTGQSEKNARLARESMAEMPPLIEQEAARAGSESPSLLKAMMRLSTVLWFAGEREKGLAWQKRALESQRRTLGSQHDQTIGSIHNVGYALVVLGRPGEGIPLLEEALGLNRQHTGEHHPSTLSTVTMLGWSYLQVGRLEEATRLLEEAHAHLKSAYDNMALETLQFLADAYRAQAAWDKAAPVQQEAVERHKASLGAEHDRTLQMMNYLGIVHIHQGKHAAAIKVLTESLEAHVRQQKRLTMTADEAVLNLAIAHSRTDHADDAARMLHDQQEVVRQAKNAVELADWQARMVNELLNAEAFQVAEPLAQQCLEVREKLLAGTWQHHSAQSLLGGVRLGQGRFDAAEALLLEAVAGLESQRATIPQDGLGNMSGTIQRLIALCKAQGDLERAALWEGKLKQEAASKQED
jgi:serine/threonine protein kinase